MSIKNQVQPHQVFRVTHSALRSISPNPFAHRESSLSRQSSYTPETGCLREYHNKPTQPRTRKRDAAQRLLMRYRVPRLEYINNRCAHASNKHHRPACPARNQVFCQFGGTEICPVYYIHAP
jgi:hypothetical protein